jgi:hypothetical protein
MPNEIVDKFNVENQDYHFEAPIDNFPVEGSKKAVMSGGVWQRFQEESLLENKQLQDMIFGDRYYKTWMPVNTGAYFSRVVYANGLFVAGTGKFLLNGGTGCYWSTDGLEWHAGTSSIASFSTMSVQDLLFKDGAWYCCGRDDYIYKSADGKNWEPINIQTRERWKYIRVSGNIVVGVTNYGDATHVTTDVGMNHVRIYIDGEIVSTSLGGGIFYAMEEYDGLFLISYDYQGSGSGSDGLYYWEKNTESFSWTRGTISGSGSGGSVTTWGLLHVEGYWLASMFYSLDGKTWQRRGMIDSNPFGMLYDVLKIDDGYLFATSAGLFRADTLTGKTRRINAGACMKFYVSGSAIYVLPAATNSSTALMQCSTDGGATWGPKSGTTMDSDTYLWMYAHLEGALVYREGVWIYATGGDLKVSFDDMVSWEIMGKGQFVQPLPDGRLLAIQREATPIHSLIFEDLFNVGTSAP